MNTSETEAVSNNPPSSSKSPLTEPEIELPVKNDATADKKAAEALTHPAESLDLLITNDSNLDHPSSWSSTQNDTVAPSSDANDESRSPFETASTMNPSRNSINTKSRFRARVVDELRPGAIAMSPRHRSTNSFDSFASIHSEDEYMNVYDEEFSSNTLPDARMNFVGDEGASPLIVAAELVSDEAAFGRSERRRIVEETIESFAHQAVTAEVVNLDRDWSSRKYPVVALLLLFIVIVFVVVLVAVLTSRDSNATKDSMSSPTQSPTSYVDPSIFRTTEELYEAVDAYRMLSLNVSNQSSFESSDVALRYGYPISTWNVSLITNFSRVFDPTRLATDIASEFMEDLGNWDVSNAETMSGMFMSAYNFLGLGLEYWNVGKVKDFSYMFSNTRFNGSISTWDTSNAEVLDNMFFLAEAFNGDLSAWDVSRVRSMNGMFNFASSFEGVGLERWDVHKVRDFSFMFAGASVFNGSLSGWNTSSAEAMEQMFSGAVIYNDNLSLWDVSKVTSMVSMFYIASAFTGDGLSSWDVSKVTSMDSMFSDAVIFDGDLTQWDVSQVSTIEAMFSNASSFRQNLSTWNVSGVSTLKSVFANAIRFNGDVSTWDVSNVNDFSLAFSGSVEFNGDLSLWDTSNAEYMSAMFSGATEFQGQGLSKWDTSSLLSSDSMFRDAVSFVGELSSWDVSKVNFMTSMFDGATSFNADLSQWNVSSVIDASFMFSGATSFNYSLCPWSARLPSTVSLERIFIGSGCSDTTDPTLNGTSFCEPC